MTRSGLVGPAFLLFSTLALAVGCGSAQTASPTNVAAQTTTASTPGSTSSAAASSSAANPVTNTDGRQVLAQAQADGTPYVLWYWGTFCPDCQVDAAAVVAATKQFGADVPIIGVPSPQDSAQDRDAFIAELEVPVPQILDAPLDLWIDYSVVSTPTVVYVDAQGNVETKVGPIFSKAFITKLEELKTNPSALA